MKKMLIIGLMVCSLLIVPMFSVVAAEKEISIDDDAGDVSYSDYYTGDAGYTSEHPNIDIENVIAIQDGIEVELQLILVDDGKIQNSDSIAYAISLSTSSNQYDVYYSDGAGLLYDSEDNELPVVYSGIGTRTLKFTFDLLSDSEVCQNLQALTYEIETNEVDVYIEYSDMAPEEENLLNVDAGGSYEGIVGESVNFSGAVSGGSSPYTWDWDFGDGNTSEKQNPTHVYTEVGEYYVTLIVTDDDGLTGYDEATVIISAGGDDGGDGGDGITDGGSNGGNGGEGSSDGGALILFGAVIAIIVVIGIVVVVAIIRR